jgi:hypothetical protein
MSTLQNGKVITDNLILYLDAANTRSYVSGSIWNDLSRNLYKTGSIGGSTYNGTKYGSFLFNGSSNYIDFGTSGNNDIRVASVMTLSAAFYCTSFSNFQSGFSWSPILTIDNYTSGNSFRKFGLYTSDSNGSNSINSNFFDGVGGSSGASLVTPVLNRYFVVTATITNSTHILYVNGVNVSQVAGISVNTNPQTARFTVGNRIGTGYDGYFGGNIFNVMVYNRALSGQEVLQNFNAMRGRFGV